MARTMVAKAVVDVFPQVVEAGLQLAPGLASVGLEELRGKGTVAWRPPRCTDRMNSRISSLNKC